MQDMNIMKLSFIKWHVGSNRGVADKLAENLLLSNQYDSRVSSSAVTKIYFPLEFYYAHWSILNGCKCVKLTLPTKKKHQMSANFLW